MNTEPTSGKHCRNCKRKHDTRNGVQQKEGKQYARIAEVDYSSVPEINRQQQSHECDGYQHKAEIFEEPR